MTIDEAIARAKLAADYNERAGYHLEAADQRQLAGWLTKYKQLTMIMGADPSETPTDPPTEPQSCDKVEIKAEVEEKKEDEEHNGKLRVFTTFSGYDSQCLALDYAGIDYELVGWSEIDKYAIQAHNALYPQHAMKNYGDITQIDWTKVPDFDLFTFSSPCQDFSIAGMMKGGEEGTGTRSSLLWECRKAIEIKRPKYLLMENVSNLVSVKFKPMFDKWLGVLSELGYTSFPRVLNALDNDVPQNRKRIFVVSILNGALDEFQFPPQVRTGKTLDDVMEDIDEDLFMTKDFYNEEEDILCDKAKQARD